MLNTTDFDFNQRYTIMHGTAFLATADTLDEIDSYRAGEDDITNHFMKIGDNKDNKIISGCMYSWWKRHPEEYADSWHEW